MTNTQTTTSVNPYTTAAWQLEKSNRFRQLKGKTTFGKALLNTLPTLNRAWQIQWQKYTGKVLIKYLTKDWTYKEVVRSKQELINHLVATGAMPKLS